MRAALATVLLATALAACGKTSCEELGERICSCSGLSTDACKRQVQKQIDTYSFDEEACAEKNGVCHEPDGVSFCEWLQTDEGKFNCGLSAVPPGQ